MYVHIQSRDTTQIKSTIDHRDCRDDLLCALYNFAMVIVAQKGELIGFRSYMVYGKTFSKEFLDHTK